MAIKRKAASSKSPKQNKKAKNTIENKTNNQMAQDLSIIRSLTLVPEESRDEFWMVQILKNIATDEYHFSFRSGAPGTTGEHCLNPPTLQSQCIEAFETSYMVKTGVKFSDSKALNHGNFIIYDANTNIPKGSWESQNKDGSWSEIPAIASQKLDQLWHSFLIAPSNEIHYIKYRTATYAINFLRMTQTNTKSNEQCLLRRSVAPILKAKKIPTERTIAVIDDGECHVILAHIDVSSLKDHTLKMSLSFVGDNYFFTTDESVLNEPTVNTVKGPLTQEAGELLWKNTFESLTGQSWGPKEEFQAIAGKYDIFAEPVNEIVTQGRKKVKVEVDIRFYHGSMQQLNQLQNVGRWYLVNKTHPKRLMKWGSAIFCVDYENMSVSCPNDPNYFRPLRIVKKFELL